MTTEALANAIVRAGIIMAVSGVAVAAYLETVKEIVVCFTGTDMPTPAVKLLSSLGCMALTAMLLMGEGMNPAVALLAAPVAGRIPGKVYDGLKKRR